MDTEYGTAVVVDATLSRTYALHPNAPGPFNPETAIRFELPEDALVELSVYDVLGQEVKRLGLRPLAGGGASRRVGRSAMAYRSIACELPSGMSRHLGRCEGCCC